MGSFLAKQPNGLYCRFSSVVDCVTHCNMTREDYIKYRQEEVVEEANRILDNHCDEDLTRVIEYTNTNNMPAKEWKKILKEMGYKEK